MSYTSRTGPTWGADIWFPSPAPDSTTHRRPASTSFATAPIEPLSSATTTMSAPASLRKSLQFAPARLIHFTAWCSTPSADIEVHIRGLAHYSDDAALLSADDLGDGVLGHGFRGRVVMEQCNRERLSCSIALLIAAAIFSSSVEVERELQIVLLPSV